MRTPSAIRRMLSHYVPAHFHDPFGLARRLVATGDPAALFAMASVVAEVAATPLDLALVPLEQQTYAAAPPRSKPLLFVCGGPRTGTTLVSQTLIRHLPVSYFSNLTALFPRSPISITRLCRRFLRDASGTRNFYGRTTHLSGVNDGLYLWDRWLGENRDHALEAIPAAAAGDMAQFFCAWEAAFNRPLVGKCNYLNRAADHVAAAVDDVYFLCLTRHPLYWAQSLYTARELIHGDLGVPYGQTSDASRRATNPVESVCEQVRYHTELADQQQQRLGRKRFRVVSYESFCSNPGGLVAEVSRDLLGKSFDASRQNEITSIQTANQQRLPAAIFDQLRSGLKELGLEANQHEQLHASSVPARPTAPSAEPQSA